MKKILFITLLFALKFNSNAQTVKLKITYKDYPVTDSDITIKIGDATIGKGRTNNDGEVSVNCSNLITKSIDVYGSKQTSNTTKTWDVKGYVNLDNNNFYHLKMEVMAKEMSEASGGFMSESSIAAMWGLTASGRNDSQNTNSNSDNNSNSETNSSSNSTSNNSSTNASSSSNSSTEEKEEPIDLAKMSQDNMLAYKQNLENDIIRYERKIQKDDKEIREAKADGKSETEIRRLEIDRQIDVLTKEKREIQLRETNAKINKTDLPFEERKNNELRKDAIKEEISALKDEDKKLKKQNSSSSGSSSSGSSSSESSSSGSSSWKNTENASTTDDFKTVEGYSDDAISKKNLSTVKSELMDLKLELKKQKLSYKLKDSAKEKDEAKLAQIKQKITDLEIIIPKYEKRLAELEENK